MVDRRECPLGEDCDCCEGECVHEVGREEFDRSVQTEALLDEMTDDDVLDEDDPIEDIADLPPAEEEPEEESPDHNEGSSPNEDQ
jgi:hypothetical protein